MDISQLVYRKRVRAWTMYDWANSAFATTIMAAVLPVYYSQVAASTLAGPALATAYWSTGLSVSFFLVAIISPILGTVSDVIRGKKLFLALFAGLGIVATGLLVLVRSGDWLLASLLFVFGRIGFAAANVFYDALLPHVARPEDQNRVSSRGYAAGYLGGGLLLAVNAVMIKLLPGAWGARLSFLSVALWWALFSIPLFLAVPEPRTLTARLSPGKNVFRESFGRLWGTLRDIKQYKELFKFLLAFLIYIDGIGTIIGVAVIYGAELGFGSLELILAILLVQFVGIPFSLIFGRLPGKGAGYRAGYRPVFLAFVLFNLLILPALGILGSRFLPAGISGAPPAPYRDTATAVGEGEYESLDEHLHYSGTWQTERITARTLGTKTDRVYRSTLEPAARLEFSFNGQKMELIHSVGPDHGIWAVEIDGKSLTGKNGKPLLINGYSSTLRYEYKTVLTAERPGEHLLSLINLGEKDPQSRGIRLAVSKIKVLPPIRQSHLGVIIGLIFGLQVVFLIMSLLLGPALFTEFVGQLSTKGCIFLALVVYTVIAVWGFFLNSVIEFWCLAWLVACVQGGSQALSRSLYSSMIPAARSGEFFGFFGIMEKFAAIIGPLVFTAAVVAFGSSRPAILSLVIFFIVGVLLLSRVDVQAGRRIARQEDERLKESFE